MAFNWQGHKRAIENEYDIINKQGERVRFILNKPQAHFIEHIKRLNIILKARQEGFSSLILGIMTNMFLMGENKRVVSISHESGATQKLLDRAKFYIKTFEERNRCEIPMKYNSRNEMVYSDKNNSFYVGTAGSKDFGRGDTINFLHLSEFAFYPDPESLLAGVLQALTPDGILVIETTANGFNSFKTIWDESMQGIRPFENHFYSPTWIYDDEFLEQKKGELRELFSQEYPMTPEQAFITSGQSYFNKQSLKWYLENVKDDQEI